MTLSMTQIIEQNITTAIKSTFSDYEVISCPTNYENFSSSEGAIFVKFIRTEYQSQNTVWEVNQDARSYFEILSCYRSVQSYSEIYVPQQQLKDVIQGLEILGRRITLVREEFVKEKNTDVYFRLVCEINHRL
ncbi:hypothetical protein IJV79_01275 [bacterium]|nr:hypothetical protein [bacterium]